MELTFTKLYKFKKMMKVKYFKIYFAISLIDTNFNKRILLTERI